MGKRLRIVFEYKARFHKLVEFTWGKDNSFYFFPKQHDTELGVRLVHERDESGGITLSNETTTGGFETLKISRHKSGYFHLQDADGQRETDGLIGPSFNEIDGSHVFLSIFPQAIETLPDIAAPDPKRDFVFHLPDEVEPFTVQFVVWDKTKTVKYPNEDGSLLVVGSITIDELDYGLIVLIPRVLKTSPDVPNRFPVRTCYLVR